MGRFGLFEELGQRSQQIANLRTLRDTGHLSNSQVELCICIEEIIINKLLVIRQTSTRDEVYNMMAIVNITVWYI